MTSISDPSHDVQYVASGSLPLDCVDVGGHAAHGVRCHGNGNLTITTAAGQRTFAVYDQEVVPVRILSVDSFTGTGVRVHWPNL